MEQLDARQVLQALVQGFDPLTGAELAAGTVLQQPQVIGALLAAIAALESYAARTRRRAQLPQNVGRPWTAGEEQQLATAFRSGEPLTQIAGHHCRTLAAIEARLERLGLLSAEQRVTRNRYVDAGEPHR
ncbi:MAG TPA: hypothetical protein VMG11_05990 [Steroidobacteraceae bacterium]|nr:hypothetical protein [Steroidobacteraceae bacterium]